MPQAQNIVLMDGAATPQAHTFAPSRRDVGVTVFVNNEAVALANRERLEVRLRELNGGTPPKVSIKLMLPVEETIDGQPVKVREYLGGIDFVIAPNGSKAERKARRVLLANALLNEDIASVIDDVESFF